METHVQIRTRASVAPRFGRRAVRTATAIAVAIVAAGVFAACGGAQSSGPADGEQPVAGQTARVSEMSGTIEIDGSSTVFPITQAMAEEFRKSHPQVQIPVGISGTGGGMKRFTAGETDISDASRPIKDSEREKAAANGVEYVALKIAYDGLSVMVNPKNDFADCVTTEELRRIWEPGSTITRWSQIRPEWPDEKIRLYGPDTDSGTFDYFTAAINGAEDASRPDYTASADDNVLVQGIAGDRRSLGYFGYAYYRENRDKLKLLAVDSGNGCVRPSETTVNNGTYAPLSRPLFIYVKKESLKRPEVRAFVEFYLYNAPSLVSEVGYVPLPEADYQAARDSLP